MAAIASRRRATPDIWPGFVDAISALLIIVIFLLMVFTLAQYFLSELLSGRDEALVRLNRQISELSEMLSLERSANVELRDGMSQVSAQLQASIAARDSLSNQLAEILPDREALSVMVADLTRERETLSTLLAERTKERDVFAAKLDNASAEAAAAAARADRSTAELENAFKTIEADKEKIELQLKRIASIERDIETLGALRQKLESEVTKLAATLKTRDRALENQAQRLVDSNRALTALRDRSKALQTRLSTAEERTALAQESIEDKDVRLKDLLGRAQKVESVLSAEKKLSASARREVAVLNRQLAALRQQLARIEAALQVSELKTEQQQAQVVDLGRRLNLALASKVHELARYRSVFFGRLREVLGDRKDIRVVGDRFVFQSEVLFDSGSADMQSAGRGQIASLAKTLLEISGKIPKEINWVLRVDGHTDRRPIKTARFPSNWELSSARAISVVRQLIEQGIPAARLVAAGFGENQPLDIRADEIALRRNRRIEFKLTER